jgi:hypothetical protein
VRRQVRTGPRSKCKKWICYYGTALYRQYSTVQYSTAQHSTYVWYIRTEGSRVGHDKQQSRTGPGTVRPEIETLFVYSTVLYCTVLYCSTVSTVFRLLYLLRDWFGPSIALPARCSPPRHRLQDATPIPSHRILPDSVKIVLTDFTGPREARHARAPRPQRSPQPFIPRSLSQAGKAELFGACLRRHPMHGRCGHHGVERVAVEATMAVASWRWAFSSKSKELHAFGAVTASGPPQASHHPFASTTTTPAQLWGQNRGLCHSGREGRRVKRAKAVPQTGGIQVRMGLTGIPNTFPARLPPCPCLARLSISW